LTVGGAKGEMLVNFLMEVLDASRNAGLEVVTTCDMSNNSVKVFKHLVFLRRHLSSGFRIKKLQLYLILPIPLNLPTTFS